MYWCVSLSALVVPWLVSHLSLCDQTRGEIRVNIRECRLWGSSKKLWDDWPMQLDSGSVVAAQVELVDAWDASSKDGKSMICKSRTECFLDNCWYTTTYPFHPLITIIVEDNIYKSHDVGMQLFFSMRCQGAFRGIPFAYFACERSPSCTI